MLVLFVAGCGGGGGGGGPGPNPVPLPQLGDPNPGLTPAMRAVFDAGREVFERHFRRSEGHGPDFNADSCKSCHSIPVSGGSSPLYRNFLLVGRTVNGVMAPVLENGVPVARNFSYTRVAREPIPATADIRAQRNAPPMFGLGVLERIDDFDVVVYNDPNDADGDGISGRVNLEFGNLGRFGYKAQSRSVEGFTRGPLFNHMGITTNPLTAPAIAGLRTIAQVSVPDDPNFDDDGVPDPELSNEDLFALVVFVREIAPPAPLPMDAVALQGEQLFESVGCAKCHVPNLVRSGTPVYAYTDLLIHDMGASLADGVTQGLATGSEFRTQPLWGVRHSAPYLHDGRADTLDKAILMHDGEALAIRNAYAARSAPEREAILRFLETR
jgi:CxxC motif-containing protein (DUF1111 family)